VSDAVAGNRQFDEDRFRELVLYIAHKTKDDPTFGRTKLAKVLFSRDFVAYAGVLLAALSKPQARGI
jgi:hypothetical protein